MQSNSQPILGYIIQSQCEYMATVLLLNLFLCKFDCKLEEELLIINIFNIEQNNDYMFDLSFFCVLLKTLVHPI